MLHTHTHTHTLKHTQLSQFIRYSGALPLMHRAAICKHPHMRTSGVCVCVCVCVCHSPSIQSSSYTQDTDYADASLCVWWHKPHKTCDLHSPEERDNTALRVTVATCLCACVGVGVALNDERRTLTASAGMKPHPAVPLPA